MGVVAVAVAVFALRPFAFPPASPFPPEVCLVAAAALSSEMTVVVAVAAVTVALVLHSSPAGPLHQGSGLPSCHSVAAAAAVVGSWHEVVAAVAAFVAAASVLARHELSEAMIAATQESTVAFSGISVAAVQGLIFPAT